MIYLNLFAIILHAALHKFRNSCKRVQRLHSKLGSYLYWTGLNRFFMELFFDITFLSILNLHTVDWDTKFTSVMVSNMISLGLVLLFVSVQAFYIIGYFTLPRENRVETFAEKFEPLLEGTNHKSQKSYIILVPVLFFFKRLLFVSTLVIANANLWVQIALLTLVTTASVIFTMWYMPLEPKRANHMEVMNDCTIMLLTYHLWCFTDIVGEPKTRHNLGYAFIGVSLSNIIVHMSFMVGETVHNIKLRCKRCKNRRNAKKAQ